MDTTRTWFENDIQIQFTGFTIEMQIQFKNLNYRLHAPVRWMEIRPFSEFLWQNVTKKQIK